MGAGQEWDAAAWDLFLRRVIAANLAVFGLVGGSGQQLAAWTDTQAGLRAMLHFQNNFKACDVHCCQYRKKTENNFCSTNIFLR